MQSINNSSAHDTYGEADANPSSSPTESDSEYVDARSTISTIYHDALSSSTPEGLGEAEPPAVEGESLEFVLGGIANDDLGSPRLDLSRMPSLNGSVSSLNSEVSDVDFPSHIPDFALHTPPEPAAKTGDPKQDVPRLTKEELHDAIDEHYGKRRWDTDFRPHLTADQHKAVQKQIQNIDEELGLSKKSKLTANDLHDAINRHYGMPTWGSDIRPRLTAHQHKTVQNQIQNIDEELGISEKRTRSNVDKPTRLGVEDRPFSNGPKKLTKKKPDYAEFHRLLATPMPELSESARALKLLAVKKKAEGSLMPKASAYADYYTNPKRLIQSAKNAAKSLTDKKKDGPQST